MTTNKVLLQLAVAGTDQVLDIHKVTAIRADVPFLLLLEDIPEKNGGGMRLTYNAKRIPDLTKVKALEFIRQPQNEQAS